MADQYKTKEQLIAELDEARLSIANLEMALTERVDMERALRERWELLQMALGAAHLGTWEWNIETNEVLWSEDIEPMFGLEPGSFDGTYAGYLDLVHPQDRELVLRAIRRSLEESNDYFIRHRLVRPDGQVHWLEGWGRVLRDENGRAVRMAGAVANITARKETEAADNQYMRELSFLSEAATEFIELPPEGDIYGLIAEKVRELSGDAIVVVNSFDKKTSTTRVRALVGLRKPIETVINILGVDMFKKPFVIGDDARSVLIRGELGKVPGGILSLSPDIPEPVWRLLERFLGVGDVYSMGFTWEGELFGNVLILLGRGDDLQNQDLIETFTKQASVALQRQRTYWRLRESEERFRRVFEDSPIGIYRTTPDGRIVMANPSLVRMLGYSSFEELAQRNLEDEGYHPDYPRSDFKQLIESEGQIRGLESIWMARDGSTLFIRENARAIRDADGNILYYEGTVEDITGRVQAEEALRESEKMYRTMAETSPDAVVVTDVGGRVAYASQRAIDIFGESSVERLLGTDIFEFIAPEERESARLDLRRTLGEGFVSGIEYTVVRKDGLRLPVEMSASLIKDSSDLPTAVIAIARDISARKQAEEALREYSERLEDMVEARTRELRDTQEQLVRQEKLAFLGQLAGGVGHELRTPLGAIRNAVYFLKLALEEPEPEVSESLEILEKELGASERIIASLLDFARAKAPARQYVNINELVRETLSRCDVPDTVEVDCQLDEAIPIIMADPDQLMQVFGNLIRNAIQAMPEGGRLSVISDQLSVDSEQDSDQSPITDNWILITVRDTGVGIPEQNLAKVFEPLFTTKAKGIGIGLALVRTLVEGHGGDIEVESEADKGSTFTIRLPIDEERER